MPSHQAPRFDFPASPSIIAAMAVSYFRLLLILPLILAQLAAPLVHAHVGGEAVAGAVHLPGLEAFSAQQEQPSALAHNTEQDLPGLAVGIATGLQFKSAPPYTAPDQELAPPPIPIGTLAIVPASSPALVRRTPPPRPFRPELASPRAPPGAPTA